MISRSKGFTLLELLLVLAIAGLLAGSAIISVGRLHDRAIFKNSLRTVQAGLRQARMLSISQRVPVTFKLENNFLEIDKDGEPYGKKFKMPEHTSAMGDKIIFYPKGDSSGGEIKIKGPDGSEYVIEIERTTGIANLKKK